MICDVDIFCERCKGYGEEELRFKKIATRRAEQSWTFCACACDYFSVLFSAGMAPAQSNCEKAALSYIPDQFLNKHVNLLSPPSKTPHNKALPGQHTQKRSWVLSEVLSSKRTAKQVAQEKISVMNLTKSRLFAWTPPKSSKICSSFSISLIELLVCSNIYQKVTHSELHRHR